MKKRKIALVLAALITLSAPFSFGASIKRNLEAYFSGIKIFVDGKQLMIPQRDEPFIYNNTTFVPLRIVTENFGYKVNWNGTTQTISLTPNTDPSSPNVSSLRYQLSTKDAEINTLKFKIQELENQVAMLKKGTNYVGSGSNILITDNNDLNTEKGMKAYLEREYEDYEDGKYDMSFNFDVDKKSSYIKVTLQSDDFKKSDSTWEKRDDSDFEDYIKDIAEKVAEEFGKDVKVYVEDKNDFQMAEFSYDESRDRFKTESIYGALVSELDDYNEFTNNGSKKDLEFEFETDEDDDYVTIEMTGKFDKTDEEWVYAKDNRKSEFNEFIEKMCKHIDDEIDDDQDIKIKIEDEDGSDIYSAKFDNSDNNLEDIDYE